MTNEITYLPVDTRRYQSELRHLVQLAKQPGWRDYAIHKAQRFGEKSPSIYANLLRDLEQKLKEK